jgi:O-antigen biosynthesis protein
MTADAFNFAQPEERLGLDAPIVAGPAGVPGAIGRRAEGMTPAALKRERVRIDGKFFRLGGAKYFPKGVTYGPFPPNAAGETFPDKEQAAADFASIKALGANLLRVYTTPPHWLLDLAVEHDLRLLVDVPWNKHLCFLDSPEAQKEAKAAVRAVARHCSAHPAVFALSVVNEAPADIVRWSGGDAVAEFIDELVAIAKREDPECLCTFANFPPTEFLRSRNVDFYCWNLYLHLQRPLENYLARLHMLADAKPIMIGECGIDTLREGETRQAEILDWTIRTAFRGGAAGIVIYSFTDEWWKDGRLVNDWAFGLTTIGRAPKPAFGVVRRAFAAAPYYPPARLPRVSVVVASYNGAPTLKACLESLEQLRYPDYEVLLVDDGSTDATPQIAAQFPSVRTIRHEKNLGLSAARNTGIYAATGEVIAFTDSDCRADEDWLHFAVGDLVHSNWVGVGGHNFLPPDDSPVAAAVMVSPGGPAHVMLTDRLAEHIPGCNMAFYRWALLEAGGFDPVYRKAGDDVDICWRLQQLGYRIGFSPSGFVWHYRRNTVRAYLRQQAGYGDAEAMLERRHPENFNRFGGSVWHGRIYSPAKLGVDFRGSVIYHGRFGSGFFQSIYTASSGLTLLVVTSPEYYALIVAPLLVLGSVVPHLRAFGLAGLAISAGLCCVAGWQAEIPRCQRRVWSRPLVALLFLLQPIVRGLARHRGHLRGQQTPLSERESLDSLSLERYGVNLDVRCYWGENSRADRIKFIERVLARLDQRGWPNKPDSGWNKCDFEVYGSRWAKLLVTTAAEYHPGGKELLRCRLEARWSFLARVLFTTLAGSELVVIGAVRNPWFWFLLVSLLPAAWILDGARRDLQRVFTTFLDNIAKEFGLHQVGPTAKSEPRRDLQTS